MNNAFSRFEDSVKQGGSKGDSDLGSFYLKQLAKTEDGRRALHFILHLTPYYDSTFTGDPYQDAFLNGQRHIALILRSFFDTETIELIERAKYE